MRKTTLCIVLIILVALTASCAALRMDSPGQTDSITGLSNVQKARLIAVQWSLLYDEYKATDQSNLTDIERQVLQSKYDLLAESREPIIMYCEFAKTGVVAPDKLKAQVVGYLARIIDLMKEKGIF